MKSIFSVRNDFISDIHAALPLVIHVSKGDGQPKQNLMVLPEETEAPN